MLSLRKSQPDVDLSAVDQRAYLNFIDWKHFQKFLKARADSSASRITYNAGRLEIMSPSWNHELIKKNLARLLEAWSVESAIPLNGYGSWLLEHEPSEAALEPDECYLLGPRAGRSQPDLAIEVKWTKGGIEKLPLYARLGVKEVWVWDKGLIVPWLLRGATHIRATRSALLPTIDLKLLAHHSLTEDQPKSIAAFLKVAAKKR